MRAPARTLVCTVRFDCQPLLNSQMPSSSRIRNGATIAVSISASPASPSRRRRGAPTAGASQPPRFDGDDALVGQRDRVGDELRVVGVVHLDPHPDHVRRTAVGRGQRHLAVRRAVVACRGCRSACSRSATGPRRTPRSCTRCTHRCGRSTPGLDCPSCRWRSARRRARPALNTTMYSIELRAAAPNAFSTALQDVVVSEARRRRRRSRCGRRP